MAATLTTRSILTLISICALSATFLSLPAWSADNQVFDGTWNVTVGCAKAPDGALPYTWLFLAEVQRGSMLGYYHKPGTVPSGTLSGQIGAGGDAVLTMQGLTGNTNYTVGYLNPGTPFRYTITSHFDSAHGTGKRNEMRNCVLDFVKR
jgi:hypothetical protein